MENPSELDINSCEGLTRLFRFAVELRDDDESNAALRSLEGRLGLAPYDPAFRGALEDFAQRLDGLKTKQRFETVLELISGALLEDEQQDKELFAELVKASRRKNIVRFSFAPSLLLCLHQAWKAQSEMYEIRYAGIGPDKALMAFASLFLNLPVFVETGPPWQPDMFFDDGEPNTEPPDLEISFPPAEFAAIDAPHLEDSVRKSRLPRAVDRGKYDLESVMIDYLCQTDASALLFVSESALASTKQSCLLARQHLLTAKPINRVSELKTPQGSRFLIALGDGHVPTENIRMISGSIAQVFSDSAANGRQLRGRSELVSTDEIQTAGSTLTPVRYLASGPVGGRNLATRLNKIFIPTKYRLADLYEITRPKTTKNDPVGTVNIYEVSAGNISTLGDLSGTLRTINVRSTIPSRLEEQQIRPGDILFAHRGPIGRVTYVSEANLDGAMLWAGQTLLILRHRKRSMQSPNTPYCDPRVLLMYLLTPAVQANWKTLAISSRSPAIPIGEIERFGLPEKLMVPRKPKKRRQLNENVDSIRRPTELILAEYHRLQESIAKMRKLEESVEDGLNKVWDSVWNSPETVDCH